MTVSDVLQIAVPNPFVEGRTRVYVIPSDPITLIDTGIATDKAFEALAAGLREHGLSVGDVQRVILTHKHIDHIGNAWKIQRESGAKILIHENECHAISDVDPGGKRFADLVAERLRGWNVPASDRPGDSSDARPKWKLESAEVEGLVDGQRIEIADGHLEVIHTPGHTMGSICLRYGPFLFSGDHILPDISPNVGGGDMRNRGMLRHYLTSLERVQNLDDEFQVMPGHGEPFTNVANRCDELLRHHEERLEKTLEILRAGPRVVYDVARELFGIMEDFHVVLGCAEANSHLEYLCEQGQVTCDRGEYRLT